MREIKVLGPGCPRCEQLAGAAKLAADQLGIEYELEKVTDMNQIIDAGVMRTPALAVDGEVVVSGHVPSAEKLRQLLS